MLWSINRTLSDYLSKFRRKNQFLSTLNAKQMIGGFSIKDSLWYNFSLKKNTCDLVFDRKEIVLPEGWNLVRANLSSSQKFLTMELRPYQEKINKDKERRGNKAG